MTKENDSRPNLGKSVQANPGHSRFAGSTTRLLRHMNARQCLRVLRDKGPLSRAEIARELGTTRTTVGNAIRELIDGGIVSAADEANGVGHVGRPGANVCLEPNGAFFVGVEVQKKVLTVQLFDFAMEVRATRHTTVDLDVNQLDKIAAKIAETSLALIGETDLPEEKIYGMGVSVPGIVSSAGRVIIPSVPKLQGVDLKALPEGDGTNASHAACLGGWQLMLSAYSKNKDLAAKLIKYMVSYETQEDHALKLGRLPTRPALYEDQDVLATRPWFSKLRPVFENAVARPSTVTGASYNKVSTDFFQTMNSILTGQISVDGGIRAMESKIQRDLR